MEFSHSNILFPYYSHVKILNKIKKNPAYCPYFEIPCNLKHTYIFRGFIWGKHLAG